MTHELVLVTGGNGSLGFNCVVHALKAGFNVRTTARQVSSIEKIKSAALIQPYVDHLEGVVVPDITTDDACLKALEDVSYVIHTASPLPGQTGDFEENTIRPAVEGTTSILKSALKVPSIKRMVITSSVTTIMGPNEDEVYDENFTRDAPPPPYANSFAAYAASKVHARQATKDFIAKSKPSFSLINVLPSFIVGRSELSNSVAELAGPSSSNGVFLANVLGRNIPVPMLNRTVHTDDVAFVSVQSLRNTSVASNGFEEFVLNSSNETPTEIDETLDIVKKNFPKEVDSGLLPLGGHIETRRFKFDGSKAEKVFNFKYQNFEKQITDLTGQYVELVSRG